MSNPAEAFLKAAEGDGGGLFDEFNANSGRGPGLRGKAGVNMSLGKMEALGETVRGTQITMEVEGGVRTVLDILGEKPGGGLVSPEAKFGSDARLTPNQRIAHPILQEKGGIPRGENARKAGLTPGVPTGPIDMRIDWWK